MPIQILTCLRCGHEWATRKTTERPTVCPSCHSPWWNKPKKEKKKEMSNGENKPRRLDIRN